MVVKYQFFGMTITIRSLALCLLLFYQPCVTQNSESYFLLTRVEEEFIESQLLYYRLLEWGNKNDVTMVEPFVCDNFIGGIPGWTFQSSGSLFQRNEVCPIKPLSWYKNIFSSATVKNLKQPISYDQFVEKSHTCENTKEPKSPLKLSPGTGYGKCTEICVVVYADWQRESYDIEMSCKPEFYKINNLELKYDRYIVVDPITQVETTLSMVHFRCCHPNYIDAGGLKHLQDVALELKAKGKCQTASVAFHSVGKGTLKDFYEGQDWGALRMNYADVDYSEDMKQIFKNVKDSTIGTMDKYVALHVQAFKDGYNERSLRACFQKLLKRVNQLIDEHSLTKVFLTADILDYNTSRTTPTWKIFLEVILQSGIQWVTTSDSYLSHLWQNDIGAQTIINQQFVLNSDFFLSHGSSSEIDNLKNLRQRLGRPNEEIQCQKKEVGDEIGKSETLKSVSTSPSIFTFVWIPIFVVLCVMARTGATPMRIVSIFSMILLAGELAYLTFKP